MVAVPVLNAKKASDEKTHFPTNSAETTGCLCAEEQAAPSSRCRQEETPNSLLIST